VISPHGVFRYPVGLDWIGWFGGGCGGLGFFLGLGVQGTGGGLGWFGWFRAWGWRFRGIDRNVCPTLEFHEVGLVDVALLFIGEFDPGVAFGFVAESGQDLTFGYCGYFCEPFGGAA